MSEHLKQLHDFDIDSSTVTLWVFKKYSRDGRAIYSGKWIELSDNLDPAMKAAANAALAGIEEVKEYDILALNHESSALTMPSDETDLPMILDQISDELPEKRVRKLKDIDNAKFYVVKFVTGESVLYGIRKTDDSWRAKKASGIISVIYANDSLELDENKSFNVSKHFDFFVLDGKAFITNKQSFESTLSYRQAHIDSFQALQQEKEFFDVFASIQPLIEYVGSNKIHLRRVCAIQQKGHYKNPIFMQNLRLHHPALNLAIVYDPNGKIVATVDGCRDIFQALLDHRLASRLSDKLYDVQSTEDVA